MSLTLLQYHRGCVRAARHRRAPFPRTCYTLLAPPSRLTPAEAAALLRLPRRVLRADLEWFVPGIGDTTGQPSLELRA